jgi:hypothetical protein
VLTGPSLRYWLPPISALQQFVERLCCAEESCEDAGRRKPEERQEREEREEPVEPSFLLAEHRRQPPAATARDRALLAVGAELASLDPDRRADALTIPAISPALGRAGLVQAATDSPDIRAAVDGIAGAAVGDMLDGVRADARRRLEEVAAELTGTIAVDEQVDSAVVRRMATVRRDVGQLKSQTSRRLNSLETTMQRRLAEVDERLRQLDELRRRLAAEAERPPGGEGERGRKRGGSR